jgi:hypothetical protein
LAFHSGREADHSPPSNAEVKEWVELYLHSPSAPSWRSARWGEHSYFVMACGFFFHDMNLQACFLST